MPSRDDLAERTRMFAKLFTIYPSRQDEQALTLRIAAYLDETRDLPALLISHALKRLVRKVGEFAPNVASIRRECAHLTREHHRAAAGLEPTGGLGWSPDGEIDVEKWLGRAKEAPVGLLAGRPLELPAGPDERKRATVALQAEIDRMEKRVKVQS